MNGLNKHLGADGIRLHVQCWLTHANIQHFINKAKFNEHFILLNELYIYPLKAKRFYPITVLCLFHSCCLRQMRRGFATLSLNFTNISSTINSKFQANGPIYGNRDILSIHRK